MQENAAGHENYAAVIVLYRGVFKTVAEPLMEDRFIMYAKIT